MLTIFLKSVVLKSNEILNYVSVFMEMNHLVMYIFELNSYGHRYCYYDFGRRNRSIDTIIFRNGGIAMTRR